MADDSEAASVDEREQKIRLAVAAARRMHLGRYGSADVDESYIGSLPDSVLEQMIDAGKGGWND